jgi:5-methylcytosine-specific restriction endonuclease McrA
MTDSKACRGCGRVLPIDSFARKLKGRAGRCKDCLREWAAAYREQYSDRVNANARAGYAADPTRKKTSKAAYYDRHRTDIRERRRGQYRENPHPAKAAASQRRQRVRNAMDAQDRAMSIAYRAAIANDPCTYCGARTDAMQVEHLYPLSKGGTDHWWNLAMACWPCNSAKYDRCATWYRLRAGGGRGARTAAVPETASLGS